MISGVPSQQSSLLLNLRGFPVKLSGVRTERLLPLILGHPILGWVTPIPAMLASQSLAEDGGRVCFSLEISSLC